MSATRYRYTSVEFKGPRCWNEQRKALIKSAFDWGYCAGCLAPDEWVQGIILFNPCWSCVDSGRADELRFERYLSPGETNLYADRE